MAKRSFLIRADTMDSGWPGLAAGGEGHRTLTEQTYTTLRTAIIEGRLQPGSKLRIEYLRTQYQVGAGTVREALTRLVSDALVTAEGQRGFRVSPITMEDIEDITRLRVQIEIEALRQSIRHGDQTWRDQLRQAFENLAEHECPITPQNRHHWEVLNMQFHDALLAGHHSNWTSRVRRLLTRHSERHRSYAIGLKDSKRNVHAEHSEIFELAMSGQEARAALALEAHIWATPHVLLKAVQEGQLVLPGNQKICQEA